MRDMLVNGAFSLGITLSEKELASFATYQGELLHWNKKINLVSVKSDLDIPIKHFLDSLTLVPFIQDTRGQVLDIGSGAGFPGIPLKIAIDALNISLLESSRKKASFLKHIIRSLHLTDITVIHNRAECLMEDETYRGSFAIIISRATLKLPQFFRMGAYFLAPKGILLAMKSKRVEEEFTEAENISQNLGFQYVARHDITLPMTGDFRTIIMYEKAF
ncbi:MAG TPA: 16S rRNA (guanine(527)-N(7))-methyltransferase RsmG [Syntrophaceae bacterium]|jgi:16S rRNA (guanine527-N7)-methyltransferase|nr:16S rRNA (guanine(527)-N(7))-methyltransferase RsmG [Syntrophaceae bacterium]